MEEAGLALLRAWETFYVIVGPAAVLVGLQFVVIVLSAETHFLVGKDAISAFSSPTIVHDCMVLLVSAILVAPWPTLGRVALALAAVSLGVLGYTGLVLRRTVRQTSYRPVLEDWIWHICLPLLAYGAQLVAAALLSRWTEQALFLVGAALVLLLFVGIHNAWDTVVFVGLRQRGGSGDGGADGGEPRRQPMRTGRVE